MALVTATYKFFKLKSVPLKFLSDVPHKRTASNSSPFDKVMGIIEIPPLYCFTVSSKGLGFQFHFPTLKGAE